MKMERTSSTVIKVVDAKTQPKQPKPKEARTQSSSIGHYSPGTNDFINHALVRSSPSPLSEPLETLTAKMVQGHHGVGTWAQKPPYATYKSPYGPNYRIGANFHGISVGRAMKFGITAGSFGVVAGIFALQFFSEVPKVRRDIMQKIPVIGEYFERDIPPSDNPY